MVDCSQVFWFKKVQDEKTRDLALRVVFAYIQAWEHWVIILNLYYSSKEGHVESHVLQKSWAMLELKLYVVSDDPTQLAPLCDWCLPL